MRKTGQKSYNTTPHASPEAALHTGRRSIRSTPHLNPTGGGERPEPPLQTTTPASGPRPAWPKTNTPPPKPPPHRSRAKQHHRVSTNAESSKDKASSIETSSPTHHPPRKQGVDDGTWSIPRRA